MNNNRVPSSELRVYPGADDAMMQLFLPVIPLTVPTLGETILLNTYDENDGVRKIVIETEEAGRRFTVSRLDGNPLQVKELNPLSEGHNDVLFRQPVPSLTLHSDEALIWQVNVDKDNIKHEETFRSFIDVLSTYALSKQFKLKVAASQAAPQSA